MVLLTQSLIAFFKHKNLMKELALLGFGHLEVFTPELQDEYLDWCQTEEGMSYLRGGANFDEEYAKKLEERSKGNGGTDIRDEAEAKLKGDKENG